MKKHFKDFEMNELKNKELELAESLRAYNQPVYNTFHKGT